MSLFTLLSFLLYEFAWASPDGSLPHSDKLSPETLFTQEDRNDSFEKVAAKYIELKMAADIKAMPLAGVEALLSEIRSIALAMRLSGRSFDVTGGAAEGQVVIRISEAYALRFYNPKMTASMGSLAPLSLLQEYSLNNYVSFQFWGPEKEDYRRIFANGLGADVGNIATPEAAPRGQDLKRKEGIRRKLPEGSAYYAYETLLDSFRGRKFTRQEFQEKRARSTGELFSYTTVASELESLTRLGILEINDSAVPHTYVISRIFERGPPSLRYSVKPILEKLGASPSPEELTVAGISIRETINTAGMRETADIALSAYSSGNIEPLVQTILLFWPERDLTPEERTFVKTLIPDRTAAEYFDSACGAIHRLSEKSGKLNIGGMLRSLLPAPKPVDLDTMLSRILNAPVDKPAEKPVTGRSFTALFLEDSLLRLSPENEWIAALYFGYPTERFEKLLESARGADRAAVRAIKDGRKEFFEVLPNIIKESVRRRYKGTVKSFAGQGPAGLLPEDAAFVELVKEMGREERMLREGDGAGDRSSVVDMYFAGNVPLGKVVAWTGMPRRSLVNMLSRAMSKAMPTMGRAHRLEAMKDGVEELYIVKSWDHAIICDEDRINDFIEKLESDINALREHSSGADMFDRIRRMRSRLYYSIEPVRVRSDGRIKLTSYFKDQYGNSGSYVIVENPGLRQIEIWPSSGIGRRPYDFKTEGVLSAAFATVSGLDDPLKRSFSEKDYAAAREAVFADAGTHNARANELEALVSLGVIEKGEDVLFQEYRLTETAKRGPPERFALLAALVKGAKGYQDKEGIGKVRRAIGRLESLYGWALLESVTSTEKLGAVSIKDTADEIMSLFDRGELQGESASLRLLKEHAEGTSLLSVRIAASCGLDGRAAALLDAAASAHDIGKAVSASNLALHYSAIAKKDMRPDELARLEAHDKDSFSILAANRIKLPPEAVLLVAASHDPQLFEAIKILDPDLWSSLSIFSISDEFRALTEPRPYPRDIRLESRDDINVWIGGKLEKGEISPLAGEAAKTIFSGELGAKGTSQKNPGQASGDDEAPGTGVFAGVAPIWILGDGNIGYLYAAITGVIFVLAANIRVMIKASIAERKMREYLMYQRQREIPGRYPDYNVEYIEGRESIRVVPGIRVFRTKSRAGSISTEILFSKRVLASLLYLPFRVFVGIRKRLSDNLDNKVSKWKLGNNAIYANGRIQAFMKKCSGMPDYPDFRSRVGMACLSIDELLGKGYTFGITPLSDTDNPWKVRLDDGTTLKNALEDGDMEHLRKVYDYLYKRLKTLDADTPDPQRFAEIYHILMGIGSYARGNVVAKKQGWLGSFLRKFFLVSAITAMLPSAAEAGEPDLEYQLHEGSKRIRTETYLKDWDGGTSLDPSDDIKAGTVMMRRNEPFYDNGTPLDMDDDFGRVERMILPDGTSFIYKYVRRSEAPQIVKKFDRTGKLVFTQEAILSDMAVRTYEDGTAETYLIEDGKLYLNSRMRSDGVFVSYSYDRTWRPIEAVAYYPDKKVVRFDLVKRTAEELKPGWDFVRGVNLPWVTYGYDFGDGALGERYEGISVKKDRLLKELSKWKGAHMRVFIFCDLRSGVIFDDQGKPREFSRHLYEDMDAFLDQARALGIKVMPVLLDYMVADGVRVEGGNKVGEHREIITDTEKRSAFYALISDFVGRYSKRSEIFAWDIMNEPEQLLEKTDITPEQLRTFLSGMVAVIKEKAPGVAVTAGARNREGVTKYFSGIGLTLQSPHYYDNMKQWFPLTDKVTRWSADMTAPVCFGEVEGADPEDKLKDIFGSGVLGGMFWQDPSKPIAGDSARQIILWRNSATPSDEKVEAEKAVPQGNGINPSGTLREDNPRRTRKPPAGSILEGFNTIMSEESLRARSFSRNDFQEKRKKSQTENFSYTTIASELNGLAALGIVGTDRSQKPFRYELSRRYGRAPPKVLDVVRSILAELPARPNSQELEEARGKIETRVFLPGASGVVLDKAYRIESFDEDGAARFFAESGSDVNDFAFTLPPNGARFSTILREILINAFEAVQNKGNALAPELKTSYVGEVKVTAEVLEDTLRVTVSDNGVGIGKRSDILIPAPVNVGVDGYRAQVNDIPLTSKANGGSGLSYARSVLASSGGFITWAPQPSGGTSVMMTVSLRAFDEDARASLRMMAAASVSPGAALAVKEPVKEKTPSAPPGGKSPAERKRSYAAPRSAVRADMDVVLYYLEKVIDQDLDLIRLSSERATLERKISAGDASDGTRNALDACLARLKDLRADIERERGAIPERRTPLSSTGNRDFRKEASEKIKKALTFIDKKNEPAACALLSAAYRILSEELEALSKLGERSSYKRRVWVDSKKDMLNVMKGRYEAHEIEGGRTVQVLTRKPQRSALTWQGIRSCDEQIEGMLNELEWINSVLPGLDALIESGRARIREERFAPGGQFSRAAFTPEEHVSAEGLLKEFREHTGKAVVSEKKVVSKASTLALELLAIGEERGAVEMMGTVKGMLSAREEALRRMIMAVWAGKIDRRSRLQLLRDRVHRRNSRLIWKVTNALNALQAGDLRNAGEWLDEIAGREGTDKGEYAAMREPEFSRMMRVLKDAQAKLRVKGGERAVKRDLEIFRERVRLAELLDSFMQDLRDQYTEARLSGAPAGILDSLFTENFNRYLDFARENNIGRGSPRVLFAMFYLPVYVSMMMPDPEHPSKEVDNPLFKAILVLVRILEANDIPALRRTIESTQAKKYANLLSMLEALDSSGITRTDMLGRDEFGALLSALAGDLGLDETQKKELKKMSAISADVRAIADVSRRDVCLDRMFEDHNALERAGMLRADNEGLFEGLRRFATDVRLWTEDIKEEWEESFIREISALSSDELAERLLSYYSPKQREIKDLRKVTVIDSNVPPNLNDIYVNVAAFLVKDYGLPKESLRKLKESLWIIREWAYRHWDGAPKERSIDIIDRAAGRRHPGVPPRGSIYGVFKFMCERGIVGEENIQYGSAIAKDLERASPTIETDLNALAGHLYLLKKVRGVSGNAYFVYPRAAAMAERILPILERFRAEDLRPSAEELDEAYAREVGPVLKISDLDVATAVSFASFGHGTNQATEVMTLLNAAVGMVSLLESEAKADPRVAAVANGGADVLGDLKYGTYTFADLFAKANSAVRFGTLSDVDTETWRRDAAFALMRLKRGKKALDDNPDFYFYSSNNPEVEELFKVLQARVLPKLMIMLGDRVKLANEELSDEAVDLNEVFSVFHENLIIKAREMTRESITLEHAEGPVLVKGNRLSLISMICNIASNGACYAYSLRGNDAKVVVSLAVEEGNAVIRISDNGPGMTPEQLEKLKKPFYTTGGTGIGMTEAYITAKLHGGSIDIESRPNEGSIFTVRIPVFDGASGGDSNITLHDAGAIGRSQDEDAPGRTLQGEAPEADALSLGVYYDRIYGEYVDIAEHGWLGQISYMFRQLFETARDPGTWLEELEEGWEMDFIREISHVPAEELVRMFNAYNPLAKSPVGGSIDLREIGSFCSEGDLGQPSLEDVYGKLICLSEIKGNPVLNGHYANILKTKLILREWIYRHWNAFPRANSYEVMVRALRAKERSRDSVRVAALAKEALREKAASNGTDRTGSDDRILAELRTSNSGAVLGAVLAEFSMDYYDRLRDINDAHSPAGYGDIFKTIREEAGFEGKTMLEIGPAHGIFMYALEKYARMENLSFSLKGIDSDPVAADIARKEGKLDVVTGDVNHPPAEFKGKEFDVVFERFPYFDMMGPEEVAKNIASCYSFTKDGGLCVIATPVYFESDDNTSDIIISAARTVGFSVTPKEDANGYLVLVMRKPQAEKASKGAGRDTGANGISDRMRKVVPELVNGLQTASYEKGAVILAIDEELGQGTTRGELSMLVKTLERLTQRNDELGEFLKNIVIRRGKGEALAEGLGELVKGGVKKENIIVITNSGNLPYFKELEGAATMTAINDTQFTEDFYYPLVEVTLFTVARILGYSRDQLLRVYREIPNAQPLDDATVLDMCWDTAANAAKPTVVIRLIPGAVKAADKAIYREIAKFIAMAA